MVDQSKPNPPSSGQRHQVRKKTLLALPLAVPRPRISATRYPPGKADPDPQPGDFLLTHAYAWTSHLIRFGERLRYRGSNRTYAYWSHAVAVASTNGDIVEALGSGVTAGNISKYTGSDYVYVRIDATEADRVEMAAFAHEQIGWQYGFLTIVSIVLSLLTTGRLRFGLSGTEICSGLVARLLERGTYIWVDPSSIMPADLARFFDVPGSLPSRHEGDALTENPASKQHVTAEMSQ